MRTDPESNVVPLFFSDDDLEQAWQRFDRATQLLHALYADPESNETDRRNAALESARAEVDFRAVYARHQGARLLRRA